MIHKFGPAAGWARLPIRVAPHPDIRSAVRAWNLLAGITMFVVTAVGPQVHIEEVAGGWSWVTVDPDYTAEYVSATVHYDPTLGPANLEHELGHVLGLADSVPAAWLAERGYVNPAVCDDPDHPAYVTYRGVMSACPGQVRFGVEDLRSLRAAGYLTRHEFAGAFAALAVREGRWPE